MANNAKMIDTSLFLQAGINPKTGLPMKIDSNIGCQLKDDIKRVLRIRDEQDAVNRYKWYNIPCNISSQELERMLYYKGQLCFFYLNGNFYFMPYALDGTIDFYGRFNTVHPVPMASGTTEGEKAAVKNQADYLSTLKLNVKYDVPLELSLEDLTTTTVLLHDYSKQLSQTIIPRQTINDAIIDVESECLPMMRTALRNSTGVMGMRVSNADEQSNVTAANKIADYAALNGHRWIAIEGQLEFQDLAGGDVAKAEEYLMSMQAIDNFRLSTYGIANGGLFDKKAYVNTDQTALNGSNVDAPLLDGLTIRQRFCDIVNSIWGVGISCELDESAINTDENGDGLMHDELDQSGLPSDQAYEQVQEVE